MKILLIEDEAALAASVLDFLRGDGMICEHAADFFMAEEKIALYDYDCLLIDLGLPGGNGMDLLKTLKKRNSSAGVLIISAKNSLDDKLEGLDLGADDYLTKPFHLAELKARVLSILRRRHFGGNKLIEWNEIVLDTEAFEARIGTKSLDLTRKEYDLLLYFMCNSRRLLTKQAIAEHLWGDDMDLADSFDFIYTHIKNLRRKLIEAGAQDYIRTVYGLGYKFQEL